MSGTTPTSVPQVLPSQGHNTLSTISQSLAFHSSPDSFLTSRQCGASGGPEEGSMQPVRARILNRDVIIISSYVDCRSVLSFNADDSRNGLDEIRRFRVAEPDRRKDQGTFSVLPAYKELMIDFFPAPNLLLTDATTLHKAQRQNWVAHMSKVSTESAASLRQIAVDELSAWADGAQIDVYESMKQVSWRMLLSVFLNAKPGDSTYRNAVSWQESLLRGQFSMFPVSVNIPFWRSARSRGLDARRKLQKLFEETIAAQPPACPFHHGQGNSLSTEDLASNSLLFTSSIVVKSVASLLTASLLNLYCFPGDQSLAARIRTLGGDTREKSLRSILRETERLSPPIIGVMRRVEQDVVLQQDVTETFPAILIPEGWDAWLYFVGANRNEAVYPNATRFMPDRFIASGYDSPGLTFGYGEKACIGKDITRQIVETVTTVMLESGIDLHGTVDAQGVRAWLGWDDEIQVESLARDLKQLPCQRPRKPIKVRVARVSAATASDE